MIFRIVDAATGEIMRSVSASNETLARRYLGPGQDLMTDMGPVMLDDSKLKVVDGVVTRKTGVATAGLIAGEGAVLTPLD